jgi:transcriptional/translational regulatory protein YebC/TACO1
MSNRSQPSRIRATRSAAPSTLIPKTRIDLNEKDSLQTLKLLDRIEDLDDVQAVHTNAEILDEYAEKYEG